MKTCWKCKETKDLSEFHTDRRAKDGKQTSCKPCISAHRLAHKKANPHMNAATEARRRARKLQATPPWADHSLINEVYAHCAEVTRITGEEHHTDHIIPLQHELVCGLHVHTNLQILPASLNISKSNSFVPYGVDVDGNEYNLDV